MEDTIEVNGRIKNIRDSYKLKHSDIADITGYSVNTVKKWMVSSELKNFQKASIQSLKLLEQWIKEGAQSPSDMLEEPVKDAEVWCFINHKGGAGKTTMVFNIAHILAKESKVLVVDCDPQINLTRTLIHSPDEIKVSLNDLIRKENLKVTSNKTIFKYNENFDFIPAKETLSSDIAAIEAQDVVFSIKESIEPFKKTYDYILLDGLPSKGPWYVSIMAASDKIVIPFTPHLYDAWGVHDVYEHVKKLRVRGVNKKVRVAAIVCSQVDRPFRVVDKVVLEAVQERYKEQFCPTLISRSVKVKESINPLILEGVTDYAKGSPVANDYLKVFKYIKNS